jgi:hypothetical protein
MKKTAEILKGLQEFSADMDWIDAELERLRKEYPNKYIAVHNRRVIEADSDLQSLIRKLREKNLNPGDIPVEFIAEKPQSLILVFEP